MRWMIISLPGSYRSPASGNCAISMPDKLTKSPDYLDQGVMK